MSIDKLKTVYSTGAFVNNVKTFFKKVNEIIDYLNDNPITPYTAPYLNYSVLLTQSGSSAPTTKVLINEIQATPLVFSRDSAGYYKCDLSSLFVALGVAVDDVYFSITDNTPASDTLIKLYLAPGNVLEIHTYSLGSHGDNQLADTPLKIEIYT